MKNSLSIILVCVAVISAATAAIVFSVKRAEIARSEAARAASVEAEAESRRRTVDAEKQIAAGKLREREIDAKAAEDRRLAAQLERDNQAVAERVAEENRLAGEAAARKAAADAEIANANHETARLEAQKAKDERLAAEAKAKADASRAEEAEAKKEAERLRSERVLAEAKIVEDRQRDYETAHRNLIERLRDVEEREAALRPDKTIADLSWAGGLEDKIVDEHGNIKKLEKVVYNPETDMSLPPATRELARADRERRERKSMVSESKRKANVAALEALYDQAREDGDVLAAAYYLKCIRTLYPDWVSKDAK